jgi:FSR family fosmidomycin resistance protein-like MFS transporter
MVLSMLAVCPLAFVYELVGGIPGAIALALVGICVISTFGVSMVMAQEYLPGRIGMASGLSIGLSIGLGGVAAVCLGALADSVDLRAAMYATAAAAVPGFVLAVMLPSSRARRRVSPQPVAP